MMKIELSLILITFFILLYVVTTHVDISKDQYLVS